MFWERCTVTGAMAAAIGSAVFSAVFWLAWPSLPFMDRVGLVFLLCLILAVGLSLLKTQRDPAMRVELRQIDYSTGAGFNLAALVVTGALIGIYWIWW
jgi:SSS family solute:Na+ symporter